MSIQTNANIEMVKSQLVDDYQVMCRMIKENTGTPKRIMQHIVVVTKKPPMCRIMSLLLYYMNGSIEGRCIN